MERLIYRLSGVDPELEMDWTEYSIAFVHRKLGRGPNLGGFSRGSWSAWMKA
jgi:hypothetical protein